MLMENKVSLISGGARGMGAAEAKLFADEGSKVVIGDILDEEGRRTEAEIGALMDAPALGVSARGRASVAWGAMKAGR